MSRQRPTPILLASLAVLTSAAAGCASTSPVIRSAAQACVERWNWTHVPGYVGGKPWRGIAALVRTAPCRVDIQYETGSDFHWECVVNRFGVFICSEHGVGPRPGAPVFKRYNAHYDGETGFLRLDRPPRNRVPSPKKPRWLLAYPIDHGFIVPFDRRGRLRTVLALRIYDRRLLVCGTGPMPHSKTLVACGAGLYCFARRFPAREGEDAACTFSSSRGSRVFYRGRLY